MKKDAKGQYREIKVENFDPAKASRRHRGVATRPIAGQGYSTKLYVQVPTGVTRYPAGAQFVIRAKLTHPENGKSYLKSYHNSPFTVLGASAEQGDQARATELDDVDQIRRTIRNKRTRKL
jgi:hypothetical protein